MPQAKRIERIMTTVRNQPTKSMPFVIQETEVELIDITNSFKRCRVYIIKNSNSADFVTIGKISLLLLGLCKNKALNFNMKSALSQRSLYVFSRIIGAKAASV